MNIETVKRLGEGYLVNGTTLVPKAEGNTDYEAVKKWIASGGVVGAEFSSSQLLEQAKAKKLQEIEDDFTAAEAVSVPYNGFEFIGGAESVTSIDAYVRLMDLAGMSSYNIWDVNGVEHALTKVQVNELMLAIGIQASANKFVKKDRKKALAAASTVAQVEAI